MSQGNSRKHPLEIVVGSTLLAALVTTALAPGGWGPNAAAWIQGEPGTEVAGGSQQPASAEQAGATPTASAEPAPAVEVTMPSPTPAADRPPSSLPPPPTPSDDDAESAATEYFELARRGEVDAMWSSLSPLFQRGQDREEFFDWWANGVVGVRGPYLSPAHEPVPDPSGGHWVQMGVQFKLDHAGAKPNSVGWAPFVQVLWYKFRDFDGKLLIDDQGKGGKCPLDLSQLPSCAAEIRPPVV